MPTALDLLPASMQAGVQAAALHGAFALPKGLKRTIAGKPIRIDGQQLALDAQLLLALQRLSGRTQLTGPSVELARQAMDQSAVAMTREKIDGVEIRELRIPATAGNLDARLYRPREGAEITELLVFYHGGGWVLGNLDSHDDFCRFLARHAEIRVLSVDYRLAPEHPFPAALDDALDAYRYAVDHAEELGTRTDTIAVGGDSAGGNLAASVSLHAVRSGLVQPVFQMLLYPAVDGTTRRRSRDLFSNGFLLSDADMDWFIDHYVADVERRKDPRLSVLLADDLSGLPPAYIVTAGFDPLRDEGEAYAQRLEESGVVVVARRFADLIHGFASLRLPGSRFEDALFEIVGTVRAGLALSSSPVRGSAARGDG